MRIFGILFQLVFIMYRMDVVQVFLAVSPRLSQYECAMNSASYSRQKAVQLVTLPAYLLSKTHRVQSLRFSIQNFHNLSRTCGVTGVPSGDLYWLTKLKMLPATWIQRSQNRESSMVAEGFNYLFGSTLHDSGNLQKRV